jgi:hypothetical protein
MNYDYKYKAKVRSSPRIGGDSRCGSALSGPGDEKTRTDNDHKYKNPNRRQRHSASNTWRVKSAPRSTPRPRRDIRAAIVNNALAEVKANTAALADVKMQIMEDKYDHKETYECDDGKIIKVLNFSYELPIRINEFLCDPASFYYGYSRKKKFTSRFVRTIQSPTVDMRPDATSRVDLIHGNGLLVEVELKEETIFNNIFSKVSSLIRSPYRDYHKSVNKTISYELFCQLVNGGSFNLTLNDDDIWKRLNLSGINIGSVNYDRYGGRSVFAATVALCYHYCIYEKMNIGISFPVPPPADSILSSDIELMKLMPLQLGICQQTLGYYRSIAHMMKSVVQLELRSVSMCLERHYQNRVILTRCLLSQVLSNALAVLFLGVVGKFLWNSVRSCVSSLGKILFQSIVSQISQLKLGWNTPIIQKGAGMRS